MSIDKNHLLYNYQVMESNGKFPLGVSTNPENSYKKDGKIDWDTAKSEQFAKIEDMSSIIFGFPPNIDDDFRLDKVIQV